MIKEYEFPEGMFTRLRKVRMIKYKDFFGDGGVIEGGDGSGVVSYLRTSFEPSISDAATLHALRILDEQLVFIRTQKERFERAESSMEG